MSPSRPSPPLLLSLAMWGITAAFYLFDFFQRVSPAALAFDLSRELAPTAVALGSLSSAYFVTYSAMQIPSGLLIDRFGPRLVQVVACLIGAIGVLVFVNAETATQASLGRFILGASGAVAWIGMLKLASNWFSPQRFASITGVSLAIGALGAVASGMPLRLAADEWGWRVALGWTSVFALALALIAIWKLSDTPGQRGYADFEHPRPATSDGRPHPVPWRDLAFLCVGQMGVTGSLAALAWLWAAPFLSQRFSLEPGFATLLSSIMMVFFAVGAIAFGTYSDRHRTRKRPLLFGYGAVALLIGLLASGWFNGSLLLTTLVLWAIGGMSGCMVLSFVFAKDLMHGQRTATVVGVVNLSVMLGSIGLPPLFGAILDHYWLNEMANGARLYPAHAFQWAFAALALWVALTWLSQSMVREQPRT